MRKYPNIISKLFNEPLMITQARHAAIVRILEARLAAGGPGIRVMEEDDDGPEPDERSQYRVVENIAIIPVHGVLVRHASDIPASTCGCGLDDVWDMIDTAEKSSRVDSLLFDFRSPGGDVTGIPELGARIGNLSKDTLAWTDDECCSGALWLATQCSGFACSPTATVGSVGVWTAYPDMSRKLANEGVNIQSFHAGRFKLLGADWKPLNDEERALLQSRVDKLHADFKAAVNSRRNIDDKYLQGQSFRGEMAKQIGLVDQLSGDLSELLSELLPD